MGATAKLFGKRCGPMRMPGSESRLEWNCDSEANANYTGFALSRR